MSESNMLLVWKHHVASDFEADPTLTVNNGVGIGGTVFSDFYVMRDWLNSNEKRRFYVAPVLASKEQLCQLGECAGCMLRANETIPAIGVFAPIEYWENRLSTINEYQR